MLDKSKKYGQVFGMPGVCFEQAGRFYNAHLIEVDTDGKPVKQTKVSVAPVPVLDTPDTPDTPDTLDTPDTPVDEPQESVDEPQNVAEDIEDAGVDFSTLSWQQLRRMVEQAGGQWINKEEAIAFLKEMQA